MKVKITKLKENAYSVKRKFLWWWIDDGMPIYDTLDNAKTGALNIYKCVDCELENIKEK